MVCTGSCPFAGGRGAATDNAATERIPFPGTGPSERGSTVFNLSLLGHSSRQLAPSAGIREGSVLISPHFPQLVCGALDFLRFWSFLYYPLGKMVASVLQWPLLRDRSTPKLRPFEGICPVFGTAEVPYCSGHELVTAQRRIPNS